MGGFQCLLHGRALCEHGLQLLRSSGPSRGSSSIGFDQGGTEIHLSTVYGATLHASRQIDGSDSGIQDLFDFFTIAVLGVDVFDAQYCWITPDTEKRFSSGYFAELVYTCLDDA